MKLKRGRFFLGTSGYSYPHWSGGVFYPPGMPQNKWLEYYSEHFGSVELNVTFYRLPMEKTFDNWYKRTPEDFRFVVKGSKYITHTKLLKDCKEPVERFFEHVERLGEKLGAVLWQLRPKHSIDCNRLEDFFGLLKERPVTNSVRHVFEFRHVTWFTEETYELLRRYGFGLCIAHSDRWPVREEVTADFIYLRFHGGVALYSSCYTDEELKVWATKTKKWLAEGKDVYAYFNNDALGYATKNAHTFREMVGDMEVPIQPRLLV